MDGRVPAEWDITKIQNINKRLFWRTAGEVSVPNQCQIDLHRKEAFAALLFPPSSGAW